MTKFLATLLTALVLCSCASTGQPLKSGIKVGTGETALNRQFMVGNWYGEEPVASGGKHQWLDQRKNDSSFIIRIRSVDSGETIDQTEYGTWGVSANIFFSITSGWLHDGLPTPADPSDPNFYDAYQILSLTSDSMTYKNLETGNVFTARRVSDDFQFPD